MTCWPLCLRAPANEGAEATLVFLCTACAPGRLPVMGLGDDIIGVIIYMLRPSEAVKEVGEVFSVL